MAAAQTQKRASANAGRTTAKRGSQSRASSSRSRQTAGRATTSRSKSTAASRTRAAGPARSAKATASRGRRPAPSRKRRERGPSATTLFIIASVIFAAWTIYPVLRIQYIEERNVQTLEAELTGLKSRNAELRTQVDELKTPEGVEQIARETLGLVKPGEQAYVVTGGSLGATATAESGTATEPFWQQALDTVFGLK